MKKLLFAFIMISSMIACNGNSQKRVADTDTTSVAFVLDSINCDTLNCPMKDSIN